MAKIGIFETPPRKRFTYDQDTEVELEFISKERMAKIIKQAENAAKKVGGSQSTIYDMFLGKAAVHGWHHVDQEKNPGHPGLVLPNGAPLAFTDDNRNLLMKACSEFSTFVFRTCTDSARFLEDVAADAEQLSIAELLAEADLEEDVEPKNG